MSINKDKAKALAAGHYASILDAQSETEVYDEAFEALIRDVLVRVGENPQRQGLARTPLHVAKVIDFLTS